jgi:hypothetical protein
MRSELSKFDDVNSEFRFFGSSAMDSKCEQAILRGRPFGGVGVLFRKDLQAHITLKNCSPDGRVVAITVDCGSIKLLCFGVYFPCDDRSQEYLNNISNIFGFVESLKENNPGCDCLIVGDFNFVCSNSHRGFREFTAIAADMNLVACDDLDVNDLGFTYFHETLGHKSLIDHVFISAPLKTHITDYKVRDDAVNLSDHLPVQFNINFPHHRGTGVIWETPRKIKEFRWDKGDRHQYYLESGDLLSRIKHSCECLDTDIKCNRSDCCLDIDIYYNEIVHSLLYASGLHIPKIPVSALKHYWSAALDDLKLSCMQMHELWVLAGKPCSGDIFEKKKNAKYKYKLAIRDAAQQFEGRFDDELLANYFNKDFNNFWKTWRKKSGSKCINIQQVAGLRDNLSIANKFAEHFSTPNNDCISRTDNSPAAARSYNVHEWLFNIEEVDSAVRALKLGKAAGDDNIAPEHLVYAHPSVVSHLKRLFNMMLLHGYVPRKFGSGIIVPIIKDRCADVGQLDNYRGITLCNVISKVFEIGLYNKFECYLGSHHLQHGFKKQTGCPSAVFAVQQVADYFISRGSTVYLTSLDASKAFDRVVHATLIRKLVDRNVPQCFISIIDDWYSKLSSVIRWNGVLSAPFQLNLGVRQGSILSPILFNIYVDDLIHQLESSNLGCHVGCYYYGCVMYADDLLLMAASISDMQKMLDVCALFGINNNIVFNPKKSSCLRAGIYNNEGIGKLHLGSMELNWVNSVKYLGIMLSAGNVLSVDIGYMKRRFYASCNSVLNSCKYVSEDVKLHLVKSFCLPMLTYCIGALNLSKQNIRELGVCWNDAFRKIFHYNRWESVKDLQFFFYELPFEQLYDFLRWKFLTYTKHARMSVILLYDICKMQHRTVYKLESQYGDIVAVHKFKGAIWDQFRSSRLALDLVTRH